MIFTRAGDTDKGRIEAYRHLRSLSPMLLGYSPKYSEYSPGEAERQAKGVCGDTLNPIKGGGVIPAVYE